MRKTITAIVISFFMTVSAMAADYTIYLPTKPGSGLDQWAQVVIKELKKQIYDSLDFISIFMKPQGEKADLKEPMVVRKGTTIVEICQRLHRDFKRKFRYSQVWGPSAKFPGQTVGLNHNVKDQDIVSIITHR